MLIVVDGVVLVDEEPLEYFDTALEIASGRGSAPCMGINGDEDDEVGGSEGNDGLLLLMNDGWLAGRGCEGFKPGWPTNDGTNEGGCCCDGDGIAGGFASMLLLPCES